MVPLLLALAALAPAGVNPCGIVYGQDWAFISQAPAGWKIACGSEAMDSTAITLWPEKQSSDKAEALIYVTVSAKDGVDLPAFVAGEITKFKAEAPHPADLVIEPLPNPSHSRRLVHYGHSTGERDETVEYIEGPTAYYIVVLTADSIEASKRYRAAYDKFLDSFSPASVTQSGG
jgi:hypothetical protein